MLKLHIRIQQNPAIIVAALCAARIWNVLAFKNVHKLKNMFVFCCLSIFCHSMFLTKYCTASETWKPSLTVDMVYWYLNKSQGFRCTRAEQHDGWTTEVNLLDRVFLDCLWVVYIPSHGGQSKNNINVSLAVSASDKKTKAPHWLLLGHSPLPLTLKTKGATLLTRLERRAGDLQAKDCLDGVGCFLLLCWAPCSVKNYMRNYMARLIGSPLGPVFGWKKAVGWYLEVVLRQAGHMRELVVEAGQTICVCVCVCVCVCECVCVC
jgi:hypothetical protein